MKNLFLLSFMMIGFATASKAQHSDIRLHGYAIGACVTIYSSFYQFGLGGGLVFKLGN